MGARGLVKPPFTVTRVPVNPSQMRRAVNKQQFAGLTAAPPREDGTPFAPFDRNAAACAGDVACPAAPPSSRIIKSGTTKYTESGAPNGLVAPHDGFIVAPAREHAQDLDGFRQDAIGDNNAPPQCQDTQIWLNIGPRYPDHRRIAEIFTSGFDLRDIGTGAGWIIGGDEEKYFFKIGFGLTAIDKLLGHDSYAS